MNSQIPLQLAQREFEFTLGLAKLVLRPTAGAHVRLDADEVGDRTRLVLYGSNGESVPERGVVFAVVENLESAVATALDRGSNLGHSLCLGPGPL